MSSQAIKRLVPLFDRVLIRKLKPVQKTASGILIPEKAQESLNRGEVMAVGPGTEKNKITLKVGDHVVLPGYGGTQVNVGETKDELILMRESEILAKFSQD